MLFFIVFFFNFAIRFKAKNTLTIFRTEITDSTPIRSDTRKKNNTSGAK